MEVQGAKATCLAAIGETPGAWPLSPQLWPLGETPPLEAGCVGAEGWEFGRAGEGFSVGAEKGISCPQSRQGRALCCEQPCGLQPVQMGAREGVLWVGAWPPAHERAPCRAASWSWLGSGRILRFSASAGTMELTAQLGWDPEPDILTAPFPPHGWSWLPPLPHALPG